jgi:hypothetical protein
VAPPVRDRLAVWLRPASAREADDRDAVAKGAVLRPLARIGDVRRNRAPATERRILCELEMFDP